MQCCTQWIIKNQDAAPSKSLTCTVNWPFQVGDSHPRRCASLDMAHCGSVASLLRIWVVIRIVHAKIWRLRHACGCLDHWALQLRVASRIRQHPGVVPSDFWNIMTIIMLSMSGIEIYREHPLFIPGIPLRIPWEWADFSITWSDFKNYKTLIKMI